MRLYKVNEYWRKGRASYGVVVEQEEERMWTVTCVSGTKSDVRWGKKVETA